MRQSAEARESLLRPSWLHRRSRAAVLAASCGKLFSIWRQDGVVDASSGVVHAFLQASQDQKQAGYLRASVLQAASSLAARDTFWCAAVYIREELIKIWSMCCHVSFALL